MLPFNSAFHIKLLLSPLFLKKINVLGAISSSAPGSVHCLLCEKALLPFVLVKLEESYHKSSPPPTPPPFVAMWRKMNVQTGKTGNQ